MRPEESIDQRSTAIAVAVSLGLHLLLLWVLPDTFHKVVAYVRPVEVLTAPVKIDESRLPPKLRFAETNPAANQAVPKAAPFASSRNQTAAQPSPAPVPVAANPDRPRASVPSGTYGLLLRRPVGVNRAGSIAVDARFSNYGDYTQRMMEAIQSSWWSIIERSRFEGVSRGNVIVRFRLHRDGTVTDAQVLGTEVTRVMTLACKDAVMAPAPYDIWRADMVAMYGESDTVTINFIYH